MEEQDWIFTFGYDHTHPVTGESLATRFVRVSAQTYVQARERMHESFGNRWSHQYESEYGAGVKRFNLKEIEFLTPEQFGITQSALILTMVVVGGMGTTAGPVVGALLLTALPQAITFLNLPPSVMAPLQGMLYTGLVLLFLYLRPSGLLGKRARV